MPTVLVPTMALVPITVRTWDLHIIPGAMIRLTATAPAITVRPIATAPHTTPTVGPIMVRPAIMSLRRIRPMHIMVVLVPITIAGAVTMASVRLSTSTARVGGTGIPTATTSIAATITIAEGMPQAPFGL